jgi:predicted ATP-grasp superfamily ATP-dependent carboligase
VEFNLLIASVHYITDYKAAATIMEKLNALLSLDINTEPILEEAKRIEESITKKINKMREEDFINKRPSLYM